jgi:hypothetical protein
LTPCTHLAAGAEGAALLAAVVAAVEPLVGAAPGVGAAPDRATVAAAAVHLLLVAALQSHTTP